MPIGLGLVHVTSIFFPSTPSEFPGIAPKKQSFRFQYREFPRVVIRKSGVLAMSIFYSRVNNYPVVRQNDAFMNLNQTLDCSGKDTTFVTRSF